MLAMNDRRLAPASYPWTLIGLLWIVSFFNAADRSVIVAVMPSIRQEFGLSDTQLALVPAVLKAYLGVNEIVVTLMLNYAIIEVLRVLSQTVFRDATSGYVSTPSVAPTAMFTRLSGTSLTLFSLVVLVVFAVMYVVFTRSRLGYEITQKALSAGLTKSTGCTCELN